VNGSAATRFRIAWDSLNVLHLRMNGHKRPAQRIGVDQATPRRAPNAQACPWRLLRVIPRTCPFLIMFAASIP
jgi:hypothetical protein